MYLRSPWHRSLLYLDQDDESVSPVVLLDPATHPDMQAAASADVERALASLPALTRSVVWLHDVEGYTHGEIARLLGRTASFSKSQLARAHARLRELLEQPAGSSSCTHVSNTC
jgi:RNA polymerase sigma-70 factor (ECF subfamily)